jgi:hypothetical protein
MFRTASLALLAVLGTAAAVSQEFTEIDGLYTGEGEGLLEADITHIGDDRYAISISTLVPITDERPGCGGGISGEAVLDQTGGLLRVENDYYDPDGDTPSSRAQFCEIGLKFDGTGWLEIKEQIGCLSHHGASCSFTGTLMHHAAGI